MRPKGRIVVSGVIGSIPIAGLTSHHLQYLLALRNLGFEVLYLEDTGFALDPWSSTWSDMKTTLANNPSYHVATVLRSIMEPFGFGSQWAYVDVDGNSFGVQGAALSDFLATADLFINVSGACLLRDEYLRIPRRAFVDTDPGFFQMWAEICRDYPDGPDLSPIELLARFNSHFTYGCNVGRPGCTIPSVGFHWQPTMQPVDLSLWPVGSQGSRKAPYTTVMKWKPFTPVTYRGKTYGFKDVEFLKFVDLPSLTGATLEIAGDGTPPLPEEELAAKGWQLRSAWSISKSLDVYREYIHASRGEWSVAKNAYVETWSGWFSERSAVYLASGRPVVAQQTGFDTWLPTGEGLFAFETPHDAVNALREIEADYALHSAAARSIAETYFRGEKVVEDLVETAMNAASASQPPLNFRESEPESILTIGFRILERHGNQ